MSKKKINDILASFCQSLDCSRIELNQENACVIQYQDILDVTLALTEDGENLNLLIPILPLSGKPENDYTMLKKLMIVCFPASALNGASLSISPYENAVMLTYASTCDPLDDVIFYNIFTNFCNLAGALIKVTKKNENDMFNLGNPQNIASHHIQSLLKAQT